MSRYRKFVSGILRVIPYQGPGRFSERAGDDDDDDDDYEEAEANKISNEPPNLQAYHRMGLPPGEASQQPHKRGRQERVHQHDSG